ncbi:uncharacterized protein LOC110053162 isoform X2 [Orbicella faveolata]|uniref:uncharacterized protein LOC110053162 isoform X2 n=1 Tax=Orbicella faveolata TaxID=48498 RepID=UPI0009E4BEBC|nr:uncharacterized protein LOC110053162 isoform X2 [Orbicella faveolata]
MRRVAHYSDMRTKQDQRHVEDTLSLNRQSRVEQDFKAFASDERIDTCIMIRGKYQEETDINAKRLTCMMFEVVYEYVLDTNRAMVDVLKEVAKFAVVKGPNIGHDCFKKKMAKRTEGQTMPFEVPLCGSGSEYPRDVVDVVLLAIKELAPKIDTDIFLEDVKQKISQELKKEQSPELVKLVDAQLNDYLKACITLTWRMVTQAPPLRLEYQSFTYKRECHKIVESHGDARDGRSMYQNEKVNYLWPGLVDGGGRIIVKGEVALEK